MSGPNNSGGRRVARGAALGFLIAFLLTTATIIYTGLLVKAPKSQSDDVGSVPQASDESVTALGSRAGE